MTEAAGEVQNPDKIRVFDTLCYSLIPPVKNSGLVGPTILFGYLANFLKLMISHLEEFWAGEEKSWPVIQREMVGGGHGSEE